jgi:hypothetical protein
MIKVTKVSDLAPIFDPEDGLGEGEVEVEVEIGAACWPAA